MDRLHEILSPSSTEDTRCVLYYVSRYVKQALFFERYQKNIFDDDLLSEPNQTVRELTLEVIEYIERRESAKAVDFDKELIYKLLDEFTALENELGSPPSKDEAEAAAVFIESLDRPILR